jgi:hypothetical protein
VGVRQSYTVVVLIRNFLLTNVVEYLFMY